MRGGEEWSEEEMKSKVEWHEEQSGLEWRGGEGEERRGVE